MKKNRQSGLMPNAEELLRYLQGELDEDRQYQLERRIMDSPLAQDALEGLSQSSLSANAIEEDAKELRERWSSKAELTTKMTDTNNWWRWAAAAAAVLFLFWIGRAYWQDQQQDQLFAEYFTPHAVQDPIRIRGEGVSAGAFDQAYQWYEAGEYEKSLAAFQAIVDQRSQEDKARLLAGVSALQLGRAIEAEELLVTLADQEGEEAIPAHWYLALLYVQEERNDEALDQLEWLTLFSEGEYLERAQALIRELTPVN